MVDERNRQRMGQEVKDKRTNKDQTVTPFKQSSKLAFFFIKLKALVEKEMSKERQKEMRPIKGNVEKLRGWVLHLLSSHALYLKGFCV